MQKSEPVSTAEYSYIVFFQPQPEGGYIVTCPALPGLLSYGGTLDEARALAGEAIQSYLACLRKEGGTIPPSDQPPMQALLEQVKVRLALA